MDPLILEAAIEKLPACVRCTEKRLVCGQNSVLDGCINCKKANAKCCILDGDTIVSKEYLQSLVQKIEIIKSGVNASQNESASGFQKFNDGQVHYQGIAGCLATASNILKDDNNDINDNNVNDSDPQSNNSEMIQILDDLDSSISIDSNILTSKVTGLLVQLFLDYSQQSGLLLPDLYSRLLPIVGHDVSELADSNKSFQISIACAISLQTISSQNVQFQSLSKKYFKLAQNFLSLERLDENSVINSYLLSLFYLQCDVGSIWYSNSWTCLSLLEINQVNNELFCLCYIIESTVSFIRCSPSFTRAMRSKLEEILLNNEYPTGLKPLLEILLIEDDICSELYFKAKTPVNIFEITTRMMKTLLSWRQGYSMKDLSKTSTFHYCQSIYLCLRLLQDRNVLQLTKFAESYSNAMESMIDYYIERFEFQWTQIRQNSKPAGEVPQPFDILCVQGLYAVSISFINLNGYDFKMVKVLSIFAEYSSRWEGVSQLHNNFYKYLKLFTNNY